MKKFLVLAFAFMPLLVLAQNLREVKGKVVDQDGAPMSGVALSADNYGQTVLSGQNGDFSISVPYSSHYITASHTDFISTSAEIDGSMLIMRMKYDTEGVKRREEQKAKARRDSLKAASAAAATAAAAAVAAKKAEEVARKEAEAKAKAEEAALVKAEKERQTAEEAARKKAEAKAKADAAAKVKAENERATQERKLATQKKDAAYGEKFKNKGLSHSVDFSYMYELYICNIIYTHSGKREYGNLSPMQLTYTLSYKFNRWCSLGIGAGVLYNAKSIEIVNDSYYNNPDFKEKRLDVPVFLNFRTYFTRTAFRPFISLTGGYYCMTGKIMWDAGVGCEFRLGRSTSLQLQAMAASVPWPDFSLTPAAYSSVISPGLKLGFNF